MFDVLGKARELFVGAVVLSAMLAAPVVASDYHGQAGHVFYRSGNGAFHGMQGNDFASRGMNARNFAFRNQLPNQTMGRFAHRGFGDDRGNRNFSAQNNVRQGGNAFDQRGGGNRFRENNRRYLASRDFSTRRGSGISVISRNQPDYDYISNFAGSVDVYRANGGTYISGYGDGGGNYGNQQQSSQPMRPRAKIVDVARMHNSCAYENGVCVIRP